MTTEVEITPSKRAQQGAETVKNGKGHGLWGPENLSLNLSSALTC